jgi:hypothetical protein
MMTLDQKRLVDIYNFGTVISFSIILAVIFYVITGKTVMSFICNWSVQPQQLGGDHTTRSEQFRALLGEAVYLPVIFFPDSVPLLCVDVSNQTTSLPPRFLMGFGETVKILFCNIMLAVVDLDCY